MSERWTASQQKAIYERGGTILVSAAAGSGKTSVLVERVVSLLTDKAAPVDADRLLVVTFTNAAADEVSLRIKKRLLQLLGESPDDKLLRRQLSLIKRARISTVHAFCSSLLREHFSELDIPPDFSVADESTALRLHDAALEYAMNEMYETRYDDMRALCELFGRSRSDAETERIIARLYNFECDLVDIDAWETSCLLELQSDLPTAKTAAGQYLLRYAKNALNSAERLCETSISLCAGDDGLTKAYRQALTSDLSYIEELLYKLNTAGWDECKAAASSVSFERLGAYKGEDKGTAERIKSLRDECKKIVASVTKNCFAFSEDEYRESRSTLLVPVKTLFHVSAIFRDKLLALKKEKRVLEFSDLERLALKLLSDGAGNQSGVAKAISDRLDYVLVDEYQDTNDVQDTIFRLVSRQEQNLFIVGDIKQSIYSFRNADPAIFLNRLSAGSEQDGQFPKNIFLSENFRSSPGVIDSVNLVFSALMSRENGGIDYTGGEVLKAGLEGASGGGMEIELVEETDETAEERHVAKRIRDMLDQGCLVTERDGTARPCTPGDFCIIMRSPSGRADAFQKCLSDMSIRSTGIEKNNLFDSSETSVMLSLLRAVDNPLRDVDVAAAALSPLFSLTADDLSDARLAGGSASLYSCLLTLDNERVAHFCKIIEALRTKSVGIPVGDFVRAVIDLLGAELVLCAGDGLKTRQANLRLFASYAASFDAGGGSLSEFCAVCSNAKEKGSLRSASVSGGRDAVSIVSAHRSKGLEWPVVFVVCADKPFNLRDSFESPVLFDRYLLLGARVKITEADGPVYIKKLPSYCAVSLNSTSTTLSEEMRILYVALTRAKSRIIVTGKCKNTQKYLSNISVSCGDGKPDAFTVGSAGCWLDWVCLAAASSLGGSILNAVTHDVATGAITVRAVTPLEGGERERQYILDIAPHPLDIEKIRAHTFSLSALPNIPLKVSVTDLVADEHTARLERPDFAGGGLLPYEKGSAMHAFMQYANYPAASNSLQDEIARLEQREFISKKQADSLDRTALSRLFSGEVGRFITERNADILREYPFLDIIDAKQIDPESPEGMSVLLQGVADCVVHDGDGIVIIDYKTDGITDIRELKNTYEKQITLYRTAIEKRLGKKVKRSIIYSFALGSFIEI